MQGKAAPETNALRKFRRRFALIAVILLIIPLVAMQFSTGEVDWGAGDFIVFAALLAGLGVVIELAIRLAPTRTLRAAAIGLSLAGFAFVWAMLAVG